MNPNTEFTEAIEVPESGQIINQRAASILSIFDTTKSERESFVSQVLDDVIYGRRNALEVHLQIKAMEEIIKRFTDKAKYDSAIQFSEWVLEEAQKHGSKPFEFHNAKIQIKDAGTTFDYSQCNDDELVELQTKHDAIKTELDERKKFLQSLPQSGLPDQINGEGEVVTVYRPAKSSTTTVSVTLS